jgi:uncharacterized membrane protein YeiH
VDTATALFVADLVGVAVFAASGGSTAVGKRLDVFGVVFVGSVSPRCCATGRPRSPGRAEVSNACSVVPPG